MSMSADCCSPVPRTGSAAAFIAALAVTGSPRQAARAIGRHAFGAEQLRTAKGGRAFAAAWDAALDLARDREQQRIHANLADLARAQEQGDPHARPATEPRRAPHGFDGSDEDWDDYSEARERICTRFANARTLFLMSIADDVAKRTAWEVLVGPVDWGDEDDFAEQPDDGVPYNVHRAYVQVLGATGMLAELAGGEDVMAAIREGVERLIAEGVVK